MKIVSKILLLILSTLLLLSLLTSTVWAETETGWREINGAVGEELYADYRRQVSFYDNKEAMGWSEEAIDRIIEDVMHPYSAQIALLSVKDDASYETRMRLLHAQGTAAGLITWIYWIDGDLHAFPAVKNKYLSLMDEIDPAVNHDTDPTNDRVISPEFFTQQDSESLRTVEDCYNEMVAAVFQQKIQNLEDRTGPSPDSGAVKGILSNAVLHELPLLRFRQDFYPYFDESDEENYPQYQGKTNAYQKLYEKSAELVKIQRNREAITDQLATTFSKLYPDDPFATTANEKISAFHTAIAAKSTISELNGQLQTTLLLLLRDLANTGADTYRTEYLLGSAQKIGLAQRIVSATSSSNTLAQISPLFQSYETDLKKADTKDTLVRFASHIQSANPSLTPTQKGELDAIVALYNRDGGAFDTANPRNLELELTRACRRLELLVAYHAALTQMTGYFSASATDQQDLQRLSKELLSEYNASDALLASAGAIADPATILRDAITLLSDTVAEAEACAFENAHSLILKVTAQQIESAESSLLDTYKALLDAALSDAGGTVPGDTGALSAAAIAKLEARKSTSLEPTPVLSALGKTYLAVVRAQISLALAHNSGESQEILSLRQALIRRQTEGVNALSFTVDPQRGLGELTALPISANALLGKARETDSLLDHYFYQVDSEEKSSSMEAYCTFAAEGILENTLSLSEAILQLDRMEAEARIRRMAEGHTAIAGVGEILNRISADLAGCPDGASILSYAENAIFLIQNRVTADQMQQQIQAVLDRITKMEFLSEEHRAFFSSAANGLWEYPPTVQNALQKELDEAAVRSAISEFNSALSTLEHALSYTDDAYGQYLIASEFVLQPTHVEESVRNQWKLSVQELYRRYLEQATEQLSSVSHAHRELTESLLAVLRSASREELTALSNHLTQEILSYRYLTEIEKGSCLSALTATQEDAIAAVVSASSVRDVTLRHGEGADSLHGYALTVSALEKEACCRILTERLRSGYTPEHYSTAIQEKLSQVVLDYESRLNAQNTVEENEAILEEALGLIGKEITLLREAQTRNEKVINDAYQALLARSVCYSDQNLSRLTETYEAAVRAIHAPRAVSDWQQVDLLTTDAILSMQEIPLDRVYTEDKLLAEGTLTTAPDSYTPVTDGYIAMVKSENGLPFDSIFSVRDTGENDALKKIRLALKENRFYPADGSAAGKDLLDRLKDAHLCAAWQITLDTDMLSSAEQYSVSLLLPKHLREEHLIGIVFLREDGSVEFYDVMREGDLLLFDTSHFSDFYLLCENTVNLLPWIIALSIVILCEVLALILLYRRRGATGSGTGTATLPVFTFSPLLLKIYRPSGGVGILWLLGGISLSLAAWIAWLVASELRSKYPQAEYPEEEPDDDDDDEEEEDLGDLFEESLPEPDPIPALVTVPTRPLLSESGPLPQVTVAEADALIPDEMAREELKTESALYTVTETSIGSRKAEINIDTISEHFNSGDTVTLTLLKEKKLVPAQTGHVKILARGTLNKPLTIIAQDFSLAALKMILLTGGTPIVAKSSLRVSGKRKG